MQVPATRKLLVGKARSSPRSSTPVTICHVVLLRLGEPKGGATPCLAMVLADWIVESENSRKGFQTVKGVAPSVVLLGN